MIRNSNPDGNAVFHVALRPNGALSDIVNAPLKYPSTQIEWELMCHLLSTDYIGRAFEDTVDGRHYLLLLDANRPMVFPSVMLWRYIIEGDDKVLVDVEQSDLGGLYAAVKKYLIKPQS